MADTPGFGEIAVWGVDPRELDRCFRDFERFLGGCRFQDCAHVSEPECVVRAAVGSGELTASRYESYLLLREEASE